MMPMAFDPFAGVRFANEYFNEPAIVSFYERNSDHAQKNGAPRGS